MNTTIVITLTPIASRRLLGMAVAASPVVQQAYQHGRLVIAGGTTNAYVFEELTGQSVDKGSYTAGVITEGVACLTDASRRQPVAVFEQGTRSSRSWLTVLNEFTADDVLIKGANALDTDGQAGVLLGGKQGGTIGQAMGIIAAVGAHLIMPVGMEKLIPDVRAAARVMGQGKMSDQWGMPCGLFIVSSGEIVTEVEALSSLFGVTATVVAAGGVAGSEGAVTLAVSGEEARLADVRRLLRQLQHEPAFTVPKRQCALCPEPCSRSRKE